MSGLRARFETARLEAARTVLTDLVIERAAKTAADVGFEWIAVPDAPNEYAALQQAIAHSQATGQPLPISSENGTPIVYLSSKADIAFRFWHDVNHVERGLSFGLIDELELALWHLGELEADGFAPESLPWRLLHADLIGQVQLMALAQRFPIDQRHFVQACVLKGFEQALIAEARRCEDPTESTPDEAHVSPPV